MDLPTLSPSRLCSVSQPKSRHPFTGRLRGHRPPIADRAPTEQTEDVTHGNHDSDLAGRRLVAVGAMLGGLAVMLGAFGAHALRGQITADALGWWQTAVEYQMWHALAVFGLGLSRMPRWRLAAWLMAGGVFVFSGTLYALAIGAPQWLGAVTPLGGILMISGWGLLAWRATRG